MIKWFKILIYFCFISLGTSQVCPTNDDFDLNLFVLPTNQLTLESLTNEIIEMWRVDVTSYADTVSKVRLEFQFSAEGYSEKTIWGVTGNEYLVSGLPKNFSNYDFTDGAGLLRHYKIDDDFESDMSSGYLPGGTYELKIRLWTNLDDEEVLESDAQIEPEDAICLNEVEDEMIVQSLGEVNILWPVDGQPDNAISSESVLYFEWENPGGNAELINYTLTIAYLDPDETPSSSISNPNNIVIQCEIEWNISDGFQNQNYTYQILSSESDPSIIECTENLSLECGKEYVWQVKAEENLDDHCPQCPTWNEESIIENFYFGSIVEGASPINTIENSVLPVFSWGQDYCSDALSYEIWVSNNSDFDDEITWQFSEVAGSQYQFPQNPDDGGGLGPGKTYYWKIRPNMGSGSESSWSEIYQFEILGLSLIEPQLGAQISSVHPTFNLEGPNDIFEYRLSLSYDIGIYESYVTFYNDEGVDLPFQYPTQDVEYGLFPGEQYYWRLEALDYDGIILGAIEDYEIYNFTIAPISITQPSNQSVGEGLNAIFSWEGPTGVPYYILKLTDEEDTELNSPFFISDDINGQYFQYENDDLEYSTQYNWNITPHDINGFLSSEIDNLFPQQTYSFTTIDKPLEDAPSLQIILTSSLDVEFTFDLINGADTYQLLISQSQEVDEFSILSDPIWYNSDITTTTYAISGEEAGLEFETEYFGQVIALKDGEQHSFPSDIIQFSTLSEEVEAGQAQISISTSNQDVRIPIISLTSEVLGADGYILYIFEDSEGSSIIEEINLSISSFPYEYINGIEVFDFEITYYIQILGSFEGEPLGTPSEIIPFNVPVQPGASEQPEISATLSESGSAEIVVNILEGLDAATGYTITLAIDEEMSNIVLEIDIGENDVSYTFSSDVIDWGETYYLQVSAKVDGSLFGQPSNILTVVIPNKPGSDEQVGLAVELPPASVLPQFEIIGTVTGAEGYTIIVSSEPDLSIVLAEVDMGNNLIITYPSDEPILQYGITYYNSAQAYDDAGPHGIPSSIVSVFIPNIISPILNEPFSWEETVPPAQQYQLLVSLLEDFSSIIYEEYVQGNSIPFSMDPFEYNTGYYWQIQGLDDNDLSFGNPSAPSFFQTEELDPPVLNSISEETSLLPDFTWNGINQASSYLLEIASEGSFESIIWSTIISETSISYSESATLLEFAQVYYWRVSALNENDEIIATSEIESFSTQSIFPVAGLSPSGGIESLTPIFQWEANDNYSNYELQIGEDAEFNTIVFSTSTDMNQVAIESGIIQSGETYFWQVQGLNSEGESISGPSEVISITAPSSGVIPILDPIDGVVVNNLTPTLSWGALEGTTTYSLSLAVDASFESMVFLEMVSGTEFGLAGNYTLVNTTGYFWKVEAATEDAVIISEIGTFSTPDQVSLTILQLDDGASISSTTPSFSWETIDGVAAYAIQISTDAEFSESINGQTGSGSFEYSGDPPLELGVTYYWRISPLNNEGGQVGSWTTTRNFTITAAFIVQLEVPSSGESVTTSNPSFQWGALEGVAKYEIEVSSNEDFSEIVWSSDEIVENNTSYPSSGAEPLDFGTTYYWHVRALSEDGPIGDYSSAYSFELSGSNTPQLEGPLNSESESLNPYFSWISINSASQYTLTLAGDEGMTELIFNGEGIQDNFFQYPSSAPPLEYGKTYYWIIVAVDGDGEPLGDPSTAGPFTTPSGVIELEFDYEDDG